MRVRTVCVALYVTVSLLPGIATAQPSDATAVIAAARTALGGDSQLNAVQTLIATGRVRQLRGDTLVPVEFELDIQLPDKYIRRDEIPAQETGATTRGFNGRELIQIPLPQAPPAGGRGSAPLPPSAAGVAAPPATGNASAAPGPMRGGPPSPSDPTLPLKQDFARLTLGFFAASSEVYPLTFAYAGVAEAPEGSADVIQVNGASGFAAKLFVSRQTHLPLMLSWSVPPAVIMTPPGQSAPATVPPGTIVVAAPGPAPAATASAEERQTFQQALATARAQALANAPPTENRLYYGDYREVNGVKLPFRIRRAIGATTTEEMTFDRFRINSKIDPRRFEVRK